MSHHCDGEPRTVGELITALSALDPNLPLYETWNESPGWFELDKRFGGTHVVWLGVHAPCSREDDPDSISVEQVEADIARGVL